MESSATSGYRNRLLTALPSDVLARLSGHLEPIDLPRRLLIIETGVVPRYLHFPESGLISLVKVMGDGRTAEVGAVGPEGMVGVTSLLGMPEPAIEAIVQIDGSGHRIDASVLRAEMAQSPPLRELALRYMHYRIDQLAQTAACNRLHTLRQRCCRWLLAAHDSVQLPTFVLTHEFLALMMGANRPRLTTTLQGLQKAGFVRYRYASVTIADRAALEGGTCECYGTLRQEAERIYRRS